MNALSLYIYVLMQIKTYYVFLLFQRLKIKALIADITVREKI